MPRKGARVIWTGERTSTAHWQRHQKQRGGNGMDAAESMPGHLRQQEVQMTYRLEQSQRATRQQRHNHQKLCSSQPPAGEKLSQPCAT
ncbi:hypothetical protein BS47DRAFT_453410 [Hydnum rufescens UP504]|uniref:Uncharacterized protein n=1 Tax=Hydnum rufescens UP504 TaxID=1448309 RepID=A0A9P6AK19_9AGAM|nr:hypothetical protein BS47DRAFT_453410 [Hydnum rufescens UP504]